MQTLRLIENDPWLTPFEKVLLGWQQLAKNKEEELTRGTSLLSFAQGYLYFGLHRTDEGWVLREWAPHATVIYLIGTFNQWSENETYRYQLIKDGIWELKLTYHVLKHGDLYALSMHWDGGSGKRIPAWADRVVQDPETLLFNAQVWAPGSSYVWKNYSDFKREEPLYIYEAHVGMAGEEERVSTFNEFRELVIPHIIAAEYNTIQLMAIPEHPYYGSFGYHVSSFFAASSRFGTPEELKMLIDTAHGAGLRVVMDLVHSHAVKNEVEGLGCYDGTRYQFFHGGPRGVHPAWDSYCFNYGKNEVLHFLLSNIQYWQKEYHFDGFRFDGVTSMLYLDHGLGKDFTSYADYFSPNTDPEAVTYFILANKLIHQINEAAVSIAEDMSGMPGLAASSESGGIGFDYRMSMGIPDFWIKMIKELPDEQWNVSQIFHAITSHRQDERVVSYTESHDQALVGDKTIIFRLIDKEMYFSMRKDQPNLIVDRGIALHKMIRLITLAGAGGAYLNFMGNEFGHPEWIDFPREGNSWSYKYARRQWSLLSNGDLKYQWLGDFDRKMISLFRDNGILQIREIKSVLENNSDQVLVFMRGNYLFVFNFNPVHSFTDYGILVDAGKYEIILSTDDSLFGGFDRVDTKLLYYAIQSGRLSDSFYLKVYLPARTAMVFVRIASKKIR